ncbi:MAG: TetR/AcrR family transcriptional regulator [Treponema sp.]|jgi:AcrR family transcriptional regulator|nr:TetR/AcrR family transcriptional regulator [Treponema sp.]
MEYIFFKDTSLVKGVIFPKSQLGFRKMCKICDAAEKLFDKKGFYETSIADICRLAGTAIGTFYIYFVDKTAIYNYLVRNYYVIIKKYISKSIKNCKTRYEMEREGLKAFIRFGLAHPQCYKIIWGSSHIDPELFEDYYLRFAESYTGALKEYGHELLDIDYSTIAWALMGIANFVCLKEIMAHKRPSEKELDTTVDEVMKLLSRGMFKP